MNKVKIIEKAIKTSSIYADLVSNMTDEQFNAAIKFKINREPQKIAEDQDNEEAWTSLSEISFNDREILMSWDGDEE